MAEDSPVELLTCGCRLSHGKPRRGCLDGQELYRRMEGLSLLIAVWPSLLYKDRFRDADWRPHEPAADARARWESHVWDGGHREDRR